MKQPLLIYGAGGLGREVLSLIRASDVWEPAGFLDDGLPLHENIKGVKVLGSKDVLRNIDGPCYVVLAIGDPLAKKKIVESLVEYDVSYPVIVHPAAVIQDPSSVRLGEGTIVCAGAIITTDVQIESHVLINLNSTIGHDTCIGAYTSVMCGANIAGEVTVGSAVMIGSGANVLNRVSIGRGSKVGMGAVVIRNVEAGITVAGVPAKQITG